MTEKIKKPEILKLENLGISDAFQIKNNSRIDISSETVQQIQHEVIRNMKNKYSYGLPTDKELKKNDSRKCSAVTVFASIEDGYFVSYYDKDDSRSLCPHHPTILIGRQDETGFVDLMILYDFDSSDTPKDLITMAKHLKDYQDRNIAKLREV
jgi:hypothetical protein